MKKKILSKKISGFTLIELMVGITIIAILSSVSIAGLSTIRQKAQDTSRLATFRDIQLAIEAYKSVNNKYPDKGTSEIISGLAPDFIAKLPTDVSFKYEVSDDKRSYCLAIKGSIFKASSQPDLVQNTGSCTDQTWVACKGKDTNVLTTICN